MGIIELSLIAIGLSMDAFAVSVTLGLSKEKLKVTDFLIPAFFFGTFQAVMPVIGFFLGFYFAEKIQSIDHWIAFILLGFIGSKMIKESFSKEDKPNTFNLLNIFILAIATSIDALAVGITFALFNINLLSAVLLIGITTFLLSIIGVKIGNAFGGIYKSKAEFAGGLILILLGCKILIEHLLF